jgi:FKBP-type peptidyl-prolyl cis-trans isomerase SlpA
MSELIHAGSLVTLRYRLSCEGKELVSTMDSYPSTFQLGTGELAPPLEDCLIGMAAPIQQSFDLLPTAFGAHNADLVRRVSRSEFPADANLAIGEAVTMAIKPGQQATGLLREVGDDSVLVDLNHPLAGKSVRFEVDVIGTM